MIVSTAWTTPAILVGGKIATRRVCEEFAWLAALGATLAGPFFWVNVREIQSAAPTPIVGAEETQSSHAATGSLTGAVGDPSLGPSPSDHQDISERAHSPTRKSTGFEADHAERFRREGR